MNHGNRLVWVSDGVSGYRLTVWLCATCAGDTQSTTGVKGAPSGVN